MRQEAGSSSHPRPAAQTAIGTLVLLVLAAMLPLVIGSACFNGCSGETSVKEKSGSSRAEVAPGSPAATYKVWETEYFLYTDGALDQALCDRTVALAKSGSLFLAVRYQTPSGAAAAAGQSPIVFTAGSEPRMALLDYNRPSGQQEVLTAKGEPAPERLDWIRSHLPTAAGTDWDAVRFSQPTVPTCPAGIQIGSGKWELHSAITLDYGGGPGCNGCTGEYWVCYEGQASPFLDAAGAAAWLAAPRSVQAGGVTCAGPTPFRLADLTNPPTPPFTLSGGGAARAETAPARITFDHFIENFRSASAFTITLSVASSTGQTWKLYESMPAGGADFSREITGPVTVEARNSRRFYASSLVPAGFAGQETVRITATASAVPGTPVWTADHAWVGPWVPPPAGPTEHRYWLQVASHASGANQSQWRTDLGLLNVGSTPAAATLRFLLPTGNVSSAVSVAAGQQRILADVVDTLPGVAAVLPAASGSAALEVISDQPLKVSSRTYNLVAGTAACYPRGTFGQSYDAYESEDGLGVGQGAWLPQLTENAAYRTNIALTNTGASAARATVTLFDGAGGQIGEYTVDLNGGQYKQENRPFFTKAGQTNMARGYARVTMTLGSRVVASASVIDNLTNDPTTIAMQPAASAATARAWVQVGSHAAGANQSQWRTDLGILNRNAEPASVEVRFHASSGTKANTVAVAAGQQAILVDVVNQIPGSGSAGLEVVSDRAVVVSSRTYNQVGPTSTCYPNGTFGQGYDASTQEAALQAGQSAYLPQLQENKAYRTNIALTNTGTVAAKVTVTLHNGSGTQIGQYTVDLDPGEYKQENKPFFTKAGQTNLPAGYAKVAVTQGGGILASASVVDNLTNDPTTMPAL